MKTHRMDRISLTFALIFLAIAGCWLGAAFVDLPRPGIGWLLAGALILIGVLGVFGALRVGRADTTSPVQPVTGPPAPEPPVARPAPSDGEPRQPDTPEPGRETR